MTDLIIFDCDGVLIDSEILSSKVDAIVLAEYGMTLSADQAARDYGGVAYPEMIAMINETYDLRIDGATYQAQCEDRLEVVFREHLSAIAGMSDLLAGLNVPFCIASGSSYERLGLCLGIAGLDHFFDGKLVSAEDVTNGKPAPDIFLLAAERNAVDPTRCLVIEDAPAGIQGAIAAGMSAVGFVGGSHRSSDDGEMLRKAGASEIFADTGALQHWLAGQGLMGR
jgi:HAD superfamily hydrolase (TIGR01509 family)